MGIELVLSMAVGYYAGRWLDQKVSADGWITGLGFIAGLYAGFRQLFITAKRMQRDAEEAERGSPRENDEPTDDAR